MTGATGTSRAPGGGSLERPLSILQLVQAPQRRGAEIFASRLSSALRASGHAVRTLYLYRHQGPGELEVRNGDRLLRGRARHPSEKLPGWNPVLLRELRREIDRFRPDVLQVNGARTVKYGALARRLAPRADWRLVYRNIGDPRVWQASPLRRLVYGLLVVPAIDGIAALSRRNLRAFRDLYGYRGIGRVIPNAVESLTGETAPRNVLRERVGARGDEPVLLFVGSLSLEKRPDRLLRVVATVRERRPDVRLWIVGDGPERHRLEEEIGRSRLEETVTLWGSRADVGVFLEAADLLLLTSDTEGMPAVVLEAALAGLPTVAPRIGDLDSCVRSGETGLLVEAGDEGALAAAALQLIDDPDLKARLGRQARAHSVQRFSMETVVPQFVELYREALASGRRPGG